MKQSKKGFFYIPTWVLILFCILCILATFFDIYLAVTIENFDSITVNGSDVAKGTEQYDSAVKFMKIFFVSSSVVTSMLAFASGWFARKRIKTN